MDCGDYRRIISKRLDGEASEADTVMLEKHLGVCVDCRSFSSALEVMTSLHRSAGAAAASISVADGVIEAIGRKKSWWLRPVWKWALPAATAAVLVFGYLVGDFLVSTYVPGRDSMQVEFLDLAYLDPYPPQSVGDVILYGEEVVQDEQQ